MLPLSPLHSPSPGVGHPHRYTSFTHQTRISTPAVLACRLLPFKANLQGRLWSRARGFITQGQAFQQPPSPYRPPPAHPRGPL